jgi:hypothetical protein
MAGKLWLQAQINESPQMAWYRWMYAPSLAQQRRELLLREMQQNTGQQPQQPQPSSP